MELDQKSFFLLCNQQSTTFPSLTLWLLLKDVQKNPNAFLIALRRNKIIKYVS